MRRLPVSGAQGEKSQGGRKQSVISWLCSRKKSVIPPPTASSCTLAAEASPRGSGADAADVPSRRMLRRSSCRDEALTSGRMSMTDRPGRIVRERTSGQLVGVPEKAHGMPQADGVPAGPSAGDHKRLMAHGRLRVHLKDGRGLMVADVTGKSDPYVKVGISS